MIIVYFPVAHWIWGRGFLQKLGFVDFAEGTVVHIVAAFSGLAAILYLGKKQEHNKNNQATSKHGTGWYWNHLFNVWLVWI
ncbi:MAG: ammonium transporter [Firmicutes bacterium]|uniref:Ammonium transporter n=1 Tax=Candidatus Gallilactobacillus intestinavium TaxID=2840838 RepID=A0A9D9EAY2_9LACO|nr:ammonium transporter [Candidatus Gallilactobacillus intestinavium]